VFENIRATFQWRVNGGQWQDKQPVANVQELSFWNPIGWTRMGKVTLNAGRNTLDIKLTKQVDAEGATNEQTEQYREEHDIRKRRTATEYEPPACNRWCFRG
jgi:hypothetical protein